MVKTNGCFVDAKLLHLRRALTRFDDFRTLKEKYFLCHTEITETTDFEPLDKGRL